MRQAARSLGLNLLVVTAGTGRDIDTAFATLVRERAGALASGFFVFHREQLVALAAHPVIYPWRETSLT
jgi:putative tryptophan/tyrosine transport system substrate-binding protein